MPSSPLIRRKAQFDLLADACARHSTARIALRGTSGEHRTFETRLLALDDDGVWLDFPTGLAQRSLELDAPAEVFFDHGGQRFGFTCRARGRERRQESERHELWAIRLSTPPLIEHRQQREHFRVSLAAFQPVEATLTRAVGGSDWFRARLLNLSCGGIAAVAAWECVRSLAGGDVFRVEFVLPGEDDPLEFPVRLAHRRRIGEGERAVLGWAFCAGDDHSEIRETLARVRRFVTQRQRELLKHAAVR